MDIREILRRGGAALTAALALTPAALAADMSAGEAPRAVPAALLTPAEPTAPAEALTQPASAEAETDWHLLLVNPWNLLPEDYEVELAVLANGLQVDARIYDDLDEMLTDCREAGLSPIVCSAYRTEETQTRLYRNKLARLRASGVPEDQAEAEAARWVAPPGTSEHQTGLALDIVAASYQLLDEGQEDTTEQQWLMANSWKYGFILRYPSEKSDITGIGYEPWHYRYVGRAAAAEIYRAGVCLEEYLGRAEAPAAATPAAETEEAAVPPAPGGAEDPDLTP